MREAHPRLGASVHRVRKAHEQVYQQLRGMIMRGDFERGERLPRETALAEQFGVSRGTVREALNTLASHNLIRKSRGAGGGSFVTLPTVDHISDFLSTNIALLSEARDITPSDLLEARYLLEGWAARKAAARRTAAELQAIRACILDDAGKVGTEEQFKFNAGFHGGVIAAAHNTLLALAAQPVFGILQTSMRRGGMSQETLLRINDDHRAISDAIAARDQAEAEARMHNHVDFLRTIYHRLWDPGASTDPAG